jgi:hypothetical protein
MHKIIKNQLSRGLRKIKPTEIAKSVVIKAGRLLPKSSEKSISNIFLVKGFVLWQCVKSPKLPVGNMMGGVERD